MIEGASGRKHQGPAQKAIDLPHIRYLGGEPTLGVPARSNHTRKILLQRFPSEGYGQDRLFQRRYIPVHNLCVTASAS